LVIVSLFIGVGWMADDVRARDLDATTAKGTAHGIVISKGFPLPRALVSPVTDMTANGAFVRTYIYIYALFVYVWAIRASLVEEPNGLFFLKHRLCTAI
jgi:hypothetical protein